MEIFSQALKALDGRWTDLGRTLHSYLGLRTARLISESEVAGWRQFLQLVLVTLAVSAVNVAVFSPNGHLDFVGMTGRMVWPFLNGAATYVLVCLIMIIGRRRNPAPVLATIFGCHLIVTSLALSLSILIAMADPTARNDVLLLRDGQGARTPIYDVACGNFDLHLRALRERQGQENAFAEFRSALLLLNEEAHKPQPDKEAMDVAYLYMRQTHATIIGHEGALAGLLAQRQEAWSTFWRSYLSLKIAHWVFWAICITSACISLLHLWKVAVHDPKRRRWATALAVVGAFLSVPIAWGVYGGVKGLRWYTHPEIAMAETVRAAQLRYQVMDSHCPGMTSHGVWDDGVSLNGFANLPSPANSPPNAPSGSD